MCGKDHVLSFGTGQFIFYSGNKQMIDLSVTLPGTKRMALTMFSFLWTVRNKARFEDTGGGSYMWIYHLLKLIKKRFRLSI